MDKKKIRWILLQSIKIAVGSSAAIFIAEEMGLQYAASAGSIALLTIVATKWETIRLSLLRLITFALSLAAIYFSTLIIPFEWGAYGIFIFMIVLVLDLLGWRATLSVNAVIGVHFIEQSKISISFIKNELLLVLIGIAIAVILNLFNMNSKNKKELIAGMRNVEKGFQDVLREVAAYLKGEAIRDVWNDIDNLQERIHGYISDAWDYQNNTFYSHPGYYIAYFEMRSNQCTLIRYLHHEIRKIREVPVQGMVVSEYISYLAEHVLEHNVPTLQIERLNELFNDMKKQPSPASREEFENRAVLYHVLMTLDEFLALKRKFVEGLTDQQKKLYWA